MKLRNKETGEIVELLYITGVDGKTIMRFNDGGVDVTCEYLSLAELNSVWEDYEEPKKYYVINPVDWKEVIGEIEYRNDNTDKINKEIGNYFSSREEAELAVRKLKAWKRLRDKGFRFTGYSRYDWNGNESPTIAFEYSDFDKLFDDEQVVADLDLLFGVGDTNVTKIGGEE